MTKNRIFFKDNPWPEGHPIREFVIRANIVDENVWFHVSLKTEDYSFERSIEYDENKEYQNSWSAPSVWDNYHRCRISTEDSNGFIVSKVSEFNKEYFDYRKINVDSNISFDSHDWDDFTFHTYLLGHDAVTDHQFIFERMKGTDLFNISWKGKIALAYAGDEEFKYEFHANLYDVELPKLETMV